MATLSLAHSNGFTSHIHLRDDTSSHSSSNLGRAIFWEIGLILVRQFIGSHSFKFRLQCREEQLMHLMQCPVFITPKYNFVVSASHVKVQ